VRGEIADIAAPAARYRGRSGALRMTVIGGSLGAQALNETVPQALALMPEAARPLVTHQSGARIWRRSKRTISAPASARSWCRSLRTWRLSTRTADLIICRAGASTVAELAAAGIASVLVPFPHAVDDHQTHNARFLSERGAAVLVPQGELTAQKLATLLSGFTREALVEMACKARDAAKPDATQAVAVECMRLAA